MTKIWQTLKAISRVLFDIQTIEESLEELKAGQHRIDEELDELDRKLLIVCEHYRENT